MSMLSNLSINLQDGAHLIDPAEKIAITTKFGTVIDWFFAATKLKEWIVFCP